MTLEIQGSTQQKNPGTQRLISASFSLPTPGDNADASFSKDYRNTACDYSWNALAEHKLNV